MLPPREKKISRRKFSPDEDELLKSLVAQFGTTDWETVSQNFQGRNPRQLRDRWHHYLRPDVVTGNWTDENDRTLLRKVDEIGLRWSAIAQLFPGRTDIGVKNRYISLLGRAKKESSDGVEYGRISQLLNEAEGRTDGVDQKS
jgi:hypothetical protein